MWQVAKVFLENDDYSERIAEIVKMTGASGVSEEWGEFDGYFVKGFWHESSCEHVKSSIKIAVEICMESELIIGTPKVEISEMEDDDWLIGWRQYFSPFSVSERLLVTPSWENYDKKKGQEVIILDPGMAFGTGTHGTTYTCLEALSDYVKSNDMTICDIGTGSGILAFAAKKLGAKEVYATDNDPLAVKVAKENGAINGLDGEIVFTVEDLFDEKQTLKFDLVIANILAPVIMELIPKVKNIVKSSGYFISSGYILSQEKMIKEQLATYGFEIIQTYTRDGWVTIVAKSI